MVTHTGIKIQTLKVKAIMGIKPLKTKHHLGRFIGMVDFYRYLCNKKLHMLEPLSKILVKESSREWTDYDKKAFEEIKVWPKKQCYCFCYLVYDLIYIPNPDFQTLRSSIAISETSHDIF